MTCFYEVKHLISAFNALTASSFILESTISRDDSIPFNYALNNEGGLFKSAANSDKAKVLIWYCPNYNGGNCFFLILFIIHLLRIKNILSHVKILKKE